MCRNNRSYGYPDDKATKEIEINTNDGKKYIFKVSASVNFSCQPEAEVMSFKLRVNHTEGGWIKISKYTGKRMEMHLNKSIFAKCGWSNDREVTDDHVDFKDLHKTRFSLDVEGPRGHPYAEVLIKVTFDDGPFRQFRHLRYIRISWCVSDGFSISLQQALIPLIDASGNRPFLQNFLHQFRADLIPALKMFLGHILSNQIQKLLHQYVYDGNSEMPSEASKTQRLILFINRHLPKKIQEKLLGYQIQNFLHHQFGEEQTMHIITTVEKLIGNQIQKILHRAGLFTEPEVVNDGVGDPEVDAWTD